VGWVDALRGKTVGLDTAPLIYFIEQSPVRIEKLRPFFASAGRGDFRLTTSFITLVEVLVQPLRNGREASPVRIGTSGFVLRRCEQSRSISRLPRRRRGSARSTTCERPTRSKSQRPSSRGLRIS